MKSTEQNVWSLSHYEIDNTEYSKVSEEGRNRMPMSKECKPIDNSIHMQTGETKRKDDPKRNEDRVGFSDSLNKNQEQAYGL